MINTFYGQNVHCAGRYTSLQSVAEVFTIQRYQWISGARQTRSVAVRLSTLQNYCFWLWQQLTCKTPALPQNVIIQWIEIGWIGGGGTYPWWWSRCSLTSAMQSCVTHAMWARAITSWWKMLHVSNSRYACYCTSRWTVLHKRTFPTCYSQSLHFNVKLICALRQILNCLYHVLDFELGKEASKSFQFSSSSSMECSAYRHQASCHSTNI